MNSRCLKSLMAVAVLTTAGFASVGNAGKISNPIYKSNAPDPGVFKANNQWYVCHTSNCTPKGAIPILSSDDLTTWTVKGYAFLPGQYPDWAQKNCHWWAPEIFKVGDKYHLYFCARTDIDRKFALGVAVSDKPEGPYKDIGKPLLVNPEIGLIDVNYFDDAPSGKKYLLWKEDRNDMDPMQPTPLVIQELTSDGLQLKDKPRNLIVNDEKWEGILVEAPTLIYDNNYYYLFYSANVYADDHYNVGVARSKNILGPYEKKKGPVLKNRTHWSGPGHQFMIQDSQNRWNVFYHSRDKRTNSHWRYLMHDYMIWDADKWPVIGDNGYPSEETTTSKP